MSSILFISNQATRTGAPIVLLHFLKWLKKNTNIPFVILLTEGGDLEPEFASLAPVFAFNQGNIVDGDLIAKLSNYDIRLIYANGVGNCDALIALSPLKCPVIFYIHELEYNISCAPNFKLAQQHTHQYIAASKAVYLNLVEKHHIHPDKLEIVHEFIQIDTQNLETIDWQQKRQQICRQLQIPEDAIIVGGSGTIEWRKGADIFVQLANRVRKHYCHQPVHFIWVGKAIFPSQFQEILHDVKTLELEPYIHFVGEQINPLDYFGILDIFVLPSREDPYPLVCLEAASVGKPILCFDRAGGMKEFVEDDCGFVIPYLDVEEMSKSILQLLDSQELRDRMGQRGKQKVQQRHDLEVVAPQLLNIINRFYPTANYLDIDDKNTLFSLLELNHQQITGKLINAEVELQNMHSQLHQQQLELQIAKSQIQQTEEKLTTALELIQAMQTSKFWKLRKIWFQVKKIMHIPGADQE